MGLKFCIDLHKVYLKGFKANYLSIRNGCSRIIEWCQCNRKVMSLINVTHTHTHIYPNWSIQDSTMGNVKVTLSLILIPMAYWNYLLKLWLFSECASQMVGLDNMNKKKHFEMCMKQSTQLCIGEIACWLLHNWYISIKVERQNGIKHRHQLFDKPN